MGARNKSAKVVDRIFDLVMLRAAIGAGLLMFLVLLALLLLPPHGGGIGLFRWWWAPTLAIGIWVLLPLKGRFKSETQKHEHSSTNR